MHNNYLRQLAGISYNHSVLKSEKSAIWENLKFSKTTILELRFNQLQFGAKKIGKKFHDFFCLVLVYRGETREIQFHEIYFLRL